jgi:hypothetical protein
MLVPLGQFLLAAKAERLAPSTPMTLTSRWM